MYETIKTITDIATAIGTLGAVVISLYLAVFNTRIKCLINADYDVKDRYDEYAQDLIDESYIRLLLILVFADLL